MFKEFLLSKVLFTSCRIRPFGSSRRGRAVSAVFAVVAIWFALLEFDSERRSAGFSGATAPQCTLPRTERHVSFSLSVVVDLRPWQKLYGDASLQGNHDRWHSGWIVEWNQRGLFGQWCRAALPTFTPYLWIYSQPRDQGSSRFLILGSRS